MGAPVQSHPVCGRVRVRTRCPSPQAVCPQPHSACDKWCRQHPPGWNSAPSTLVLHKPVPSHEEGLTAAESVSSSARWGEGCQRPLVPPSPPLPRAPGLVSPGDSEVEMAAGSLPSGHPLCFFPLSCWALFSGHILPDYTDPPSPRPLLGGDHVSLSQPEFPQSLPRGPTLQ